jgi:hypothetical protein
MFAGLCAVLLVAACDGPTTGPGRVSTPGPPVNPAPPSPPAPVPGQTFTVSGIVSNDANVPVPGAYVVVLGQETVFATTAADGSYSIAGVRSSPVELMSPLLSASKPGFFTGVEFADRNYLPIASDTRLDFRLVPQVAIALGEIVHGRSPADAPICSHWGYGTTACQRFALTVPASGSLQVTLSAPLFNFDLDILGPSGAFEAYSGIWISPVHVTIPVRAGSTYEIRVIGGWTPAREFELTTTMR